MVSNKFSPYLESTPIRSLIQPNLSASCFLVSWTPADKESLHPVVLPHKDKLSLSSGFRESAVSLSLSCISMVFLAYQVSLNVIGIFYDCISLTGIGVYLMGWNRYMKLSKKFEISKVNFWINLLIYNGIDLVSNWIFRLSGMESSAISPTIIIPENQSLSLYIPASSLDRPLICK